MPLHLEKLEDRTVLSPAFDVIGLSALRRDPAFADLNGRGASVAIIDTGLDQTHPLLQPNYVAGADFVYGGSTPTPVAAHGTHVAGIVGARNNEIGVATGVGLIGLQVFTRPTNGQQPTAQGTNVNRALQWVLDNRERYNIVAVNMSLGAGHYTSEDQAATDLRFTTVRRLEAAGVTVVSAAGNSYFERQDRNTAAPAIFSTLAVGAVWQDGVTRNVSFGPAVDRTTGADRVTVFSQRPATDNVLFAPGAFITSTVPGNKLAAMPGTSMASPMVAGAVALVQQASMRFGGRYLAPTEVRQILQSSADRIFDGDDEDSNVRYTQTTYPRLNVYRAVQEVRRRAEQIAPPPPGGSGDPNGTIAGAYLGPRLDGSQTGTIVGSIGTDAQVVQVGDKDVDIIRFQVVSAGTVTLEVLPNLNDRRDFDSFLRLFDSSGNELANNDDKGISDRFSRLSVNLAPGTYYAGVSGFPNSRYDPNRAASGVAGYTGNYQLNLDLSLTDPNGVLTGAVPVELRADNEPRDLLGLIGADFGQPVGPADVDLFQVRVPDNGTLSIEVNTPFTSNYVDSYLRVFDANGNELAFNDDASGPASVHRTDSYLNLNVTRGTTYYLGVSSYQGRSYNPTNLSGRAATTGEGQYILHVTFSNPDQNGSLGRALATLSLPINNQPGIIGTDTNPQTGQPVTVGDRDVDFIKVRPAAAGVLEVRVDSSSVRDRFPLNGWVDTVLTIWDASGNRLAENDDASPGTYDPFLRLPVRAGTDYFVSIAGFGNHNFNPFQLGSGSPGDVGSYFFSARLLSTQEGDSVRNDRLGLGGVRDVSIGQGGRAILGADDASSVAGDTDIDLYRYVAPADQVLMIRGQGVGDNAADTFLRVFDASGNELAFNDDENANTTDSLVRLRVTAGQTYYFGVTGFGANPRGYSLLTGEGASAGSQGDYLFSVDEAAGQVQFSATAYTVAEGAGTATITVSRTGGTAGGVTVAYATADGTARAGADYTPASGTLTFGSGETSRTFTVAIADNNLVTLGRTVELRLSDPTNGLTLGGQGTALLTIQDNDLPAVPDGPLPAQLGLAAAGFAKSREQYQNLVSGAYSRYLRRGPDPAGLDAWTELMLAGTVTEERLEAGFIGSTEYIANNGGQGRGWIVGMYRDLLGRDPGETEVQGWLDRLQAGVTEAQVAFGFAASAERQGQRVRRNYNSYLLREPSQQEVDGFVALFVQGVLTNQDIVARFVGSPEYYGNPQKGRNNRAVWIVRAYEEVLFRSPALGEVESWLNYLS